MFKFFKNQDYGNVIMFSIFLLIGVLITVLSLFLFAVLITVFDLEGYFNGIFATVSLIIGSFFASYFYVKKVKSKGFLNGILMGGAMYLLIFIASLIISDKGFSLTSLFYLISALLSGGIAGILVINKKQNLKYLK